MRIFKECLPGPWPCICKQSSRSWTAIYAPVHAWRLRERSPRARTRASSDASSSRAKHHLEHATVQAARRIPGPKLKDRALLTLLGHLQPMLPCKPLHGRQPPRSAQVQGIAIAFIAIRTDLKRSQSQAGKVKDRAHLAKMSHRTRNRLC